MRKAIFALTCNLLLLTTACTMNQPSIGNPEAPYPPAKPQVGEIYHLPTGIAVNEAQLRDAIADARIVYVGETHDNPAAHRVELLALKALAERYPGQVSLGMEMFTPEQQEALDRWVAGELNEKAFLKSSRWYDNWRMDYAYYRDILGYARTNKIPVVGLNATREMVKAVGTKAPAELDEATRAQLPELELTDPYQSAITAAIYAGHSEGGKTFEGFMRVQTLWDETMAQNVAAYLAEDSKRRMVVMAGGNHVRYGFGIPRRVFRRLPTSYVLVGSREIVIPKEKQERLMDVELPRLPMPPYDYIVYTEYESLPSEPVKLGVRMEDADGQVVVAGVVPGSSAAQAGVAEGDVILELDGVAIADRFDLIYEVSSKTVNEKGWLKVLRGGSELRLELSYSPLQHAGGQLRR
jgi:uncharacterized iron-regulated protein